MLNWKIYLLLIGIIVAMLQYKLWFGDSGIIENDLLERDMQEKSQQIKQIQRENKRLQQQGQFFEKNAEAFEGLARQKLGLTKPNERFIQIIPSTSSHSP